MPSLHMNSLRYSSYLLTIDQVSTDHRPSVDQWLTDTSVKYRRTIGKVSAKSRRSVGEVSMNKKLYRPRHIWKDYWPCLDRVSSDYRPSLDRLSTHYRPLYRPTIDRVSNEYWPSVDRVSTDYRPLYRPIHIGRHYLHLTWSWKSTVVLMNYRQDTDKREQLSLAWIEGGKQTFRSASFKTYFEGKFVQTHDASCARLCTWDA